MFSFKDKCFIILKKEFEFMNSIERENLSLKAN